MYSGVEYNGAQAMFNNAQSIGLSVTTAILVVGMLLLVVLVFVLVMVILRVKKAKNNSEIISKGKDNHVTKGTPYTQIVISDPPRVTINTETVRIYIQSHAAYNCR